MSGKDTDATDRLRLVQWLSPAFPIGAFAYSQGLEHAITAGEVQGAAALEAWIAAVLRHGSGRADAIFLARARDDGADVDTLADLCLAMAPGAERAQELAEKGRAFAAAVSAIAGAHLAPLPYPVAVGAATRSLRVETQEVVMLWLQGLAAQLVLAAVRFVPLGQSEGQAVLSRLAPVIAGLAADYASAPLSEASSSALRADLAGLLHETMDVRIFRS